MLTIRLGPTHDDNDWLPPHEVASQIEKLFPNAVIDWEEADRRRREHLEQQLSLGVPEIVLSGERELFGEAVMIKIKLQEFPGYTAVTEAIPNVGLVMWSEPDNNRDFLEAVAERLAGVLPYDWSFVEDPD